METEDGPYRRRQHSDQQARRDRAAVHPRHRPTKFAQEIVDKVGIAAERRVNQLTDAEVLQIRETIDRDYMVEGDLRREAAMNIKRLMDLGCYRGLRHAAGCRSAASARTPMPAPARVRPSRSPARRSKRVGSSEWRVANSDSLFATPYSPLRWSRWNYGGVEIN